MLFLLLEIISVVLIVNYNNFQRVKFLNSSNRATASVYEFKSQFTDYFNLGKINEQLAEENAGLRELVQKLQNREFVAIADTLAEADTLAVAEALLDEETTYEFIPARIVNNSVNKQYNYVTLNKGRRDGVMPDMGIIGPGGVVVGVVTNVTEHYSSGPSILNRRWFVSSKIKKNDYFGRLAWDGYDYQRAKLNEIPFHVELAVGDTIVTSGYSSIFPEGFLIGTIEEFNHSSGANFYDIIISLSTDFKALSHVELVKNNFIEEQTELEELNRND
jgi:rod shape-determining protein MreC